MRAMVLRGKSLAVEDVETPRPGPGQVLAKVLACGICGSDLHAAKYMDQMIANTVRSGRSAWDTLDPAKPIVMGHEFVAEVVANGEGTESWKPGTRVSSVPMLADPSAAPNGFYSIGYSPERPGAYGEYLLLSAPLLLPVAEGLANEVAATTEPCAVGLHAVRQSHIDPGEAALVMGAGPIGLMTLLWLKQAGVHVAITDPAEPRRALAKRLGADIILDPRHGPVLEQLTRAGGAQPRVVFECVGIEGTLEQAMELAQRGGRVVVVGVCMNEDRIYPMVGINKQLTMQFVLGYTADEFAEALRSLGDGSIDTSPLVTRKVRLDELPAAFESLADPRDCKVVLTFD